MTNRTPTDFDKPRGIISDAIQRHHRREETWAGPFVAEAVKESRNGVPENVNLDSPEDLWFVIAYLVECIHDNES